MTGGGNSYIGSVISRNVESQAEVHLSADLESAYC